MRGADAVMSGDTPCTKDRKNPMLTTDGNHATKHRTNERTTADKDNEPTMCGALYFYRDELTATDQAQASQFPHRSRPSDRPVRAPRRRKQNPSGTRLQMIARRPLVTDPVDHRLR